MKKAATTLNVNYSTAKTILQTFRKEKRVTKQPKHMTATKKIAKHEQLLARMLRQRRVKKVIGIILKSALKQAKKKKLTTKQKPIQHNANSQAKTLPNTVQPIPNPISNGFHRIESADQMILFEAETSGPKCGQMSRGIMTEVKVAKKDLFYVHYSFSYDELKTVAHFNKPLNNTLIKPLPSIIQQKLLLTNKTHELLKGDSKNRGPVLNTMNHSDKTTENNNSSFDFHQYGTMIMANAYQR